MVRDSLSRPLLRTHARIRELAAWEFLLAIRELYPSAFRTLETLAEPYLEGLDPNDADESERVHANVVVAVSAWTASNNISSPLIDSVALEIAELHSGPDWITGFYTTSDAPPPIAANPLCETLPEFLSRARDHYRASKMRYLGEGFVDSQTHRGGDRAKYLALYLVGENTFGDIASGSTVPALSKRSEKTVSGEARKFARQLRITMPDRRGRKRTTATKLSRLVKP